MKIIKVLFFFVLLQLIIGCNQSNPMTVRTPTEQELHDFIESKGIKALTVKKYSNYDIILGDSTIYSLSMTSDGKPQYLGNSWRGTPEQIDVMAITQETTFIGVIISQNDVIEHGKKLKVIFEDNSIVNMPINQEKAFIIDHPQNKVTNSSKAKIQIFNNKGKVIYQNF